MPATSSTELLAQLQSNVVAFTDSDRWKEWLRWCRSFYSYSVNNQFLIAMQAPHATQVAGYRAWQSKDRQVRKGERGIRILAPMSRTSTDDATGDKTPRIFGFRAVTVFDISQTDGDQEPPGPVVELDGSDQTAVLTAVCEVIEGDGYRAEEDDDLGGALGRTEWTPKRVALRGGPSAQQAKTAVHELAHIRLHAPGSDGADLERATKEIEAESVAYVVSHTLGLDTSDYSLGYLASWTREPDPILATATRINHAAQAITASVAAALSSDRAAA